MELMVNDIIRAGEGEDFRSRRGDHYLREQCRRPINYVLGSLPFESNHIISYQLYGMVLTVPGAS